MRHSVIRIAALAAAISVMAALPATAGAATTGGGNGGAATLTVSIGKATLSQRLVVNLPLTVTCTLNPGTPAEFPQSGSGGQLTIVEAIGKKSTSGTAYLQSITCDGMAHKVTLQVLAEPASGGLHFRKGAAAARVTLYAAGYDANFMFVQDTADTGWVGINIK